MSNLQAFMDGVTGAGLFGKRSWPGAPTEMIDSRTRAEFNARLAARKFLHRNAATQYSVRRSSEDLTRVVDIKAEGRG